MQRYNRLKEEDYITAFVLQKRSIDERLFIYAPFSVIIIGKLEISRGFVIFKTATEQLS